MHQFEGIMIPYFIRPLYGLIGHWVLVYVELSTRTIYLFNSLDGYKYTEITINTRKFLYYHKESIGIYDNFNDYIIKSNKQDNGVDCGGFYNIQYRIGGRYEVL